MNIYDVTAWHVGWLQTRTVVDWKCRLIAPFNALIVEATRKRSNHEQLKTLGDFKWVATASQIAEQASADDDDV